MKLVWALVILLVAVLAAADVSARAEEPAVPAQQPSLVLITIDTMRTERMSCYGHLSRTTPHIDRWARRAIQFNDAVATVPLTTPSHASILTGLHPRSHAVLGNCRTLEDRFVTLAEALRASGYRTGAFVSSVVLDPAYGLNQGFEYYGGGTPAAGRERKRTDGSAARPGQGRGRHLERPANETVDDALAWLSKIDGDTPFFAWVHFYDPHLPYEPPRPYRTVFGPERGREDLSSLVHGPVARGRKQRISVEDERRLRELYDAEVAFTDYQFGRLMHWLQRQKRHRQALVAVIGDHGEMLGEHDGHFGHQDFLFDGSLRIPLLLCLPDSAGNLVRGETVSPPDLMPTLLSLLECDSPDTDGRNLLQVRRPEPVFCETYRPEAVRVDSVLPVHQHALHAGRWKMILGGSGSTNLLLFDLNTDPAESENAAKRRPQIVKKLSELWRSWSAAHPLPLSEKERKMRTPDTETREKLKQLGYVE